jgi:ferredoxin
MYKVIEEECISCEACITECPTGAIEMVDDIAVIDQDKCEECGDCVDSCPSGAIIEE